MKIWKYILGILFVFSSTSCAFPKLSRSFLENFSTLEFLRTNQGIYTVSFTVSGLLGDGLVVTNQGESITVNENGTYTFSNRYNTGDAYNVTVTTPPADPLQECVVSSGTGSFLVGNVEAVQITCGPALYVISGTVVGLDGSGLVLTNTTGSGVSNVNVNTATFSFPGIEETETFSISISANPSTVSQTCNITSGTTTGTMGPANRNDLVITCVSNSFLIQANVTGIFGTLGVGQELNLLLDGAVPLAITADGLYPFAGTYVASSTTTHTIAITNAGGVITTGVCTVAGGPFLVTNADRVINISCSGYAVAGDVTQPGGSVTSIVSGPVGLTITNTGGVFFTDQIINVNPGIVDFSFTNIPGGSDYSVSITTQPPNQTCTITAGATGTSLSGSVDNIIINCNPPTPSFVSPNGTIFNNDTNLSLTGLLPGGQYRYTIGDGTQADPTCTTGTATTTTVPFNNNNLSTIKVIQCRTGWSGPSAVATRSYVLQVAAPSPSLASGSFLNSGQTVGFSTTTTGTTWTCTSSVTSPAVPVDPECGAVANTCNVGVSGFSFPTPGANTNVRARSCKALYQDSDILVLSYQPNQYTVGGTISGLPGAFGAGSFVLQNNAGDDLTIAANGSFTFATPLNTGANYTVTVLSNPINPWYTCSVTSGTGAISNANINSVSISCVVNSYSVSGTITHDNANLPVGLVVTNGVDSVIVPANTTTATTPLSFPTSINSGDSFSLSISQEPPGQVCTVASAFNQEILGANVNNVSINCVSGYRYQNSVSPKKPAPIHVHMYRGEINEISGNDAPGDGIGAPAATFFNGVEGVTFDGKIGYIADFGNHKIKKIDPGTGLVTNFVGSGTQGNVAGLGTSSDISNPYGLVTDGTYLYFSEVDNHRIKRTNLLTGFTETIAGDNTLLSPLGAFADSPNPLTARFNAPAGLALEGETLYIADRDNQAIRVLNLRTRAVSTLLGPGTLSAPEGITIVGNFLYVTDTVRHSIYQIDRTTGISNLWAGPDSPGATGFRDAVGSQALFHTPKGITHDGRFLYVTDSLNYRIRRISLSDNRVITVAGSGLSGNLIGTGAATQFNALRYIMNVGDAFVFGSGNRVKILISSGLTTYFPLNGVRDSLVDGSQLSAVGSPTYGLGRFGESEGAASTSIGNAGFTLLPTANTLNFTFSAWIRWDGSDSGTVRVIFHNGNTSGDGYGLVLGTNDSLAISRGAFPPIPTNIRIRPNEWTHVALVSLESSNYYLAFVNGKQALRTFLSPSVPTGNFRIGNNSTGSGNFFPGRIAEVRYYARPLAEAEINDLAKLADPGLVGVTYASGPTELVYQLPFHNNNRLIGPFLPASDASLYGGAYLTDGKENITAESARFPGAGAYAEYNFNDIGLPEGDHPRTVCMWVFPHKLPDPSQVLSLFSYGDTNVTDAGFKFFLQQTGGGLHYIRFGSELGNKEFFAIHRLVLNRWTHLCGTFDGANGQVYVDGKALSGTNLMSGLNTVVNAAGNRVYLGTSKDLTQFFNGKIDDVQVYSRTLTAIEIRRLGAQISSGLVVRLDFSGDFSDVSGYGHTIASFGASLTSDRFGTNAAAVSFAGAGRIDVTDNALVLGSGSSARTVCAYVRVPSVGANGGTIVNLGAVSSGNLFSLENTNQTASFSGYLDDISGNTPNYGNVWSLFCGVYTGSGSGQLANLYWNGALLDSAIKGAWNTSPSNLRIGQRLDNLIPFTGVIDEVLVYNRALTQLEIRALSGPDPRQIPLWNPNNTLSSLKLQLQADSLSDQVNGSAVTEWKDNSGNGYNFLTGPGSPTYSQNTATLNGSRSVYFNAAGSQYLTYGAPIPSIPSNQSHLFFVTSRLDTGNRSLFSNGGGMSFQFTFDTLQLWQTSLNIRLTTLPVIGQNIPYILASEYDTAVGGKILVNGQAQTSVNATGIPFGNSALYLGSDPTTSIFYNGFLSEMLYFNAPLAPASEALVNCYLSRKYGIFLNGLECF